MISSLQVAITSNWVNVIYYMGFHLFMADLISFENVRLGFMLLGYPYVAEDSSQIFKNHKCIINILLMFGLKRKVILCF